MTLIDVHSRLGVEEICRTEDEQQSGAGLPSGWSCAMHDQMYAVTEL